MSLTYGFYNSLDGDRTYDAVQLSSIFDGLIQDGIFSTIGTGLVVSESSDMDVIIGIGRAWFNHTWTNNDANIVLTVEDSEIVLDRIDIVVLEVDSTESVRENTIKIIEGTPSSDPVAPTLVDTEDIHQYVLAEILVEAGVTEITDLEITNMIGVDGGTPFVTGLVDTIDVTDFFTQWNADMDVWFEEMKDQLSVDAAGNLQIQIDDLEEVVEELPLGAGSPIMMNGGFNIWQRGTVFSAITSGYTADRWQLGQLNTPAVISVLQSTDVPTDSLSEFSLKVLIVTADAAVAADDAIFMTYNMEGYDFAKIYGKEVTLSFWVKSPKTGVHCVSFRNSDWTAAYVCEYTIAAADTWEKHSVTLTLDEDLEEYTDGAGLRIHFTLMNGTSRQCTATDTWEASNALSSSSQVNACDTADEGFYLSDVQLDVGNVAQEFVYQTEGEDLDRCMRYCQAFAFQNPFAVGVTSSQANAGDQVLFKPMRAAPTFISNFDNFVTTVPSNVGDYGLYTTSYRTGSGTVTLRALTTKMSFLIYLTASGGFTGLSVGQLCRFALNDDTMLEFDAELL